MSDSNAPKLIFGPGYQFTTVESLKPVLKIAQDAGVQHIDTAQNYGNLDELLGLCDVTKTFIVDSKDPGGSFGPIDAKSFAERCRESARKLGGPMDIFYLHMPDAKTPFSEYVPTIDQLHKEGLFKRFGLSNHQAHQIEALYDYCKKNNYVLPSVAQDQYNAFCRGQETALVPTLRKLSMSLYAFSPLAGGFLTKTRESYEAGAGRFNTDTVPGQIYMHMFGKPKLLDALEDWNAIAKHEGCTRSALGFRWIRFHSALKAETGDGLVIGVRTTTQLEQTLKDLQAGPLKPSTVQKIDEIWEHIADEAPSDTIEELFGRIDQSLLKPQEA